MDIREVQSQITYWEVSFFEDQPCVHPISILNLKVAAMTSYSFHLLRVVFRNDDYFFIRIVIRMLSHESNKTYTSWENHSLLGSIFYDIVSTSSLLYMELNEALEFTNERQFLIANISKKKSVNNNSSDSHKSISE